MIVGMKLLVFGSIQVLDEAGKEIDFRLLEIEEP
jgi:hypothetical protein